jgi:hypothetical protein
MSMDSATDLVRVPVKADSGKLFYVEGKGNIGVVDVEKARVYWREGDIAVFRTSFIRNRNLRATPQACCGLLCIFDAQYAHLEGETQTVRNVRSQHESGCRSRYRLGVIGFLQPTTTTKVVIYEWVGGVKPDGLTPLFLYEMIAPRSKHFFQVSHHFREVRMELKIERKEHVLHFVNMCSCPAEIAQGIPICSIVQESQGLFVLRDAGLRPRQIISSGRDAKNEWIWEVHFGSKFMGRSLEEEEKDERQQMEGGSTLVTTPRQNSR